MAGPWEKYQAPAEAETGPWSKYQQAAPEAPAAPSQPTPPQSAPAPEPQRQMDPLPALVENIAPGYGAMAGRSTFEAAGSALGTGLGMAGGGGAFAAASGGLGTPAGATLGGTIGAYLGVMGGSAAYDGINELILAAQGKEQLGPGWARLQQTVDNMTGAGAFEVGTMGLMRLTAPAGRAVLRGLSGVPEHIAANVRRAQEMGINPTLASAGSGARAWVGATSRMPMVGTMRAKQAPERITEEIGGAIEGFMKQLGPDITRDEAANMLALGGRTNALREMRRIDEKFTAARAYAASKGNQPVFPADPMALAAQKYLDEVGQSAIYVGVPRGKVTAVDINKVTQSKSIEDFMSGMALLRGVHFTFPQMDALRTTANRLLAKAAPTVPGGPYQDPDGFRAVSAVKEALRGSQTAARDPELAERMFQATEAHREWKQFLNHPALSEFRAAVPGIATKAELSRPRSAEVQNLLDTLVRERSPEVLTRLHNLMGPEAYGQIRRRAFMETFTQAVEPLEEGGVRLHIPKLRSLLGLETKEGMQRLEALLHGSDIKVGDVRRLLDALEVVGDQFLPQVNQFMARNLMLRTAGGGTGGGLKGLLGGLILAGAGGSAATFGIGTAVSGTLGIMLPLWLVNQALSSRRVFNSVMKATEYHKANRPMEQFVRRALREWELEEDGYSSTADTQAPGTDQ